MATRIEIGLVGSGFELFQAPSALEVAHRYVFFRILAYASSTQE
jgi:hypothetical protein